MKVKFFFSLNHSNTKTLNILIFLSILFHSIPFYYSPPFFPLLSIQTSCKSFNHINIIDTLYYFGRQSFFMFSCSHCLRESNQNSNKIQKECLLKSILKNKKHALGSKSDTAYFYV